VVICDEEKVNEDGKYEGIPTLIVEVLSPSSKGKDMVTKLSLYMKSDVPEYWIVNPENRSILQYFFSDNRDYRRLKEPGGRKHNYISCLCGLGDTLKRYFFRNLVGPLTLWSGQFPLQLICSILLGRLK